MSSDRILTALEDGVLTATLNRPDKRNAMDRLMVAGLHAVLETADADSSVSLVALRGAGTDFCAGADLQELLDSVHQDPADIEADAMRLGDLFIAIRRLPKPVIAVVRGRALAGGCGLANACDAILASDEAQFGYPEIRRGFVPAMVMAMLVRTVGEKIAFDLVATGRLLTASEAHSLGLVSRVFPSHEFEQSVKGTLLTLAGSSGSALSLIKRHLYELDNRSFEQAIALGARVNAVARLTPDFRAAVAAFLNRGHS